MQLALGASFIQGLASSPMFCRIERFGGRAVLSFLRPRTKRSAEPSTAEEPLALPSLEAIRRSSSRRKRIAELNQRTRQAILAMLSDCANRG